MGIRIIALGAAATAAFAAVGAAVRAGRDAQAHWGVDPVESGRVMPGDEMVTEPDLVDTRVVDIDAPIDRVWPWLVQMGYGRAGWYSYDVLGMDEPSALAIDERWQTLGAGDVVPTHPGGGFVVRAIEAPHSLVLYIDRRLVEDQERLSKDGRPDQASGGDAVPANVRVTGAGVSQAVPGDFAASWVFQLEPHGDGGTRLVERFRVSMETPAAAAALLRTGRGLMGLGLFLMTRRHMLGVKDRAEGRFGMAKRSFPIHPGERVGVSPTPA